MTADVATDTGLPEDPWAGARRAVESSGGGRLRRVLLLALVALPCLVLCTSTPGLAGHLRGLAPVQWHTALELVSMLVCGSIAAIAWNARELEVPRGVHVLGAACAGALLLDLAHTLSFPGMPDLVSPNSIDKTALLSMASRLLLAIALLAVAALPWRLDHQPVWVRWVPFGVAAYVAVLAVPMIVWPESMPTMGGKGALASSTKLAGVFVLMLLFLTAAALLFQRRHRQEVFDARSLLWATLMMTMGEACLTHQARLDELGLIAAHLYKLGGLCLVFRTLVTDSIRAPYQRLLASRQRLRHNEDELRTITDNIPAMVAFVDADQRYRFVNRNYQRWLGMDPEKMLGRSVQEVFGQDHYEALQEHLERALSGQTFAVDHRITGVEFARGRWLNIMYMPKVTAEGCVTGVYILSSDITEVMVAERRALFLAEHDELTTLPNRAAFQVAVGKAVEASARDMSQFAVIFVDVDRFKVVNDTLGHSAGDQLLQALSTRLKQVVRGQDLVARMGGDEMCVLLHNVRDNPHAAEIAERILGALRAPVELRPGLQHHVTASAGIAVFPQDGTDVQTLLRHADIAMYRAKSAGRDGFALFGAHDGGPAEARLTLELELRTAIDAGQLVLHYQPRVDVKSGQPVGMEALVRWQHPERGLLAPGHFIDIAEETGLIVPMGAWVLREAGQAMRRLQIDNPQLCMSVNVSARQFKNPHLVDEVEDMIERAGCAPHQFELELTESAVMDQPELAAATMGRLKALGVRLAIDDFGTGYSSLAALKRFPVDCVKVDRSFVNDIPGDHDDAALTRAIIAMGHSLGLQVVAEGVERRDQLDFLRRESCDEYQGYFFAKPLAEDAFAALLANLPRPLAVVAG